MTTDNQTNFVFFSDQLEDRFPVFHQEITSSFKKHQIEFDFLDGTSDVWSVDFMPIQVRENKFIQFTYKPDYYAKYKKYQKFLTDVDQVLANHGIEALKSDIILDGGNVIKARNWAIMTNKIFNENPGYSELGLLRELERLLEVERIITVPFEPKDEVAHADVMVRYLNEDTVLINRYTNEEDQEFQWAFRSALRNSGLNFIELQYNPYKNESWEHANGIYTNYLQIKGFVFVPKYDLPEDDSAAEALDLLFQDETIVQIPANDIAKEGGVLNCVSWNVLKSN